ncbi:MAG: DUF1778 domain-containing protein [Candidatus Acidiferrales bacterium]
MARTQQRQHRIRKEQRLEARLTPEQKCLIERAATLRGTTLTEFVVASAQDAAAETIKNFEILHLRDEAREVFVNAVLNPPAPNRSARAAAARYKKQRGL